MARKDANRLTIQDWRHLLTVGGLVVGVLGTLLLGGRLQADAAEPPLDLATVTPAVSPVPQSAASEATPTAEPQAGGRTQTPAAPEPRPVPPPAETVRQNPTAETRRPKPAARKTDANAWTLQFMVTCEAATADRLSRDFGNDPGLLLLPVRVEDRDCTRVCWGDYGTRDAAVARGGVPAGLLKLNGTPMPRRIADLR